MMRMYGKCTHSPMVAALFLSMFMLASCRTYGGHGTEQATYDKLIQVVTTFEEELASARNELPALEQAARSNAALQPYVSQFEAMVVSHAGMVEDHKERLAQLEVRTGPIGRLTRSYRNLNQALGAIVSEQRELKISYEALAMDVRRAVFGETFQVEVPAEIGRYQIVPPYYEKLRYALERARLDMEPSLAG
jgi:hypothetical protein